MTSNYFSKNALKTNLKKTIVEIFTLNNRLLGNLKIYEQIKSIFFVILFILFFINFSFFEWFWFFNIFNLFKILKARAFSLTLIFCLCLFRMKN